jgi:P-type Ca2+ transporter type 2C
MKQFKDFLVIILIIAAVVSFLADQMADVYLILAVIIFNAVLGFTQEFKAEKAIESIKNMIEKKALVLRDGKKRELPAEECVPGDIIILEEGRSVPADARLLAVKDLRTSEASLTGESMPIDKNTDPVDDKDEALGDRKCMVFNGTNTAQGSGKAVVTATGENTEIGKIAVSMSGMEIQDSNFKKKTAKLGKQMGVISIVTSAIVFAIGFWFREMEFQEILFVTVATLVSSIPEGLPAIISIVLAIGAKRMAKKNVIIREFTATEMMGSVSVILTDKTGTITKSILTIKKIFTGSNFETEVTGDGYNPEGEFKRDDDEIKIEDNPVELKLLSIAAYCNNAHMKEEDENEEKGDEERKKRDYQVVGDPTEAAMFVLALKADIKNKEPYSTYKVVDDLPFNSEQKFRAALVDTDEGKQIFVIGAPERILELSSELLTSEGTEKIDEENKGDILEKMDEWAGEAMRVLALAYKKTEGDNNLNADKVKDLVWTGIAGIIDPPRKGVKESIEECKTAGIRVIMVTGDHKKTAAAIALQIGIIDNINEEDGVPAAVTGKELMADDEKFNEYLQKVNVFARMDPNVKLKIAERLQKKDTLIAMTGDGVNDAPALKRADVGIAMGQRGTDVAKDAADIVLQDDNFSSIVNAVREGRIVFNNIKITSYFLLTCNFALVTVVIVTMIIGWPLPLTAVVILYVNLVSNGITDIALATEPGHHDIMLQPPVKKNESILKKDVLPYLLLMAVVMLILTLIGFNYYLPEGLEKARTAAFLIISMTQVFNVFNMRALNESVFSIGLFTNKWINLAVLAAIIMQLVVIKVPFFINLFGFENFPLVDFVVIALISTSVLWAGELYKLIVKKP